MQHLINTYTVLLYLYIQYFDSDQTQKNDDMFKTYTE